MNLSRLKIRLLSFSLFFACGAVYPLDASAQLLCSAVFGREIVDPSFQRDFRKATETYNEKGNAFTKGDISKVEWTEFKRNFRQDFAKLLRSQGLKIQLLPDVETGLLLLPEGPHPLSRLAAQLQKRGLFVVIRPEIWREGSLGQYAEGVIALDEATILNGRVSEVMAHEIRHAVVDARASEESGVMERAFLTYLIATKMKSKILPNFTEEHAYKEGYGLDEILAHRQSAALLIRRIKRQKDLAEGPSREDLEMLTKHGNRIRHFVESWLATAKILEGEVRAGSYKTGIGEKVEGQESVEFALEITKDSQGAAFRTEPQDPGIVGLTAVFRLSMAEADMQSLSVSARHEFIQMKIREISSIVLPLQKSAVAFEEAVRAFDGRDTAPLEASLRDLSSVLAKVRRFSNVID